MIKSKVNYKPLVLVLLIYAGLIFLLVVPLLLVEGESGKIIFVLGTLTLTAGMILGIYRTYIISWFIEILNNEPKIILRKTGAPKVVHSFSEIAEVKALENNKGHVGLTIVMMNGTTYKVYKEAISNFQEIESHLFSMLENR